MDVDPVIIEMYNIPDIEPQYVDSGILWYLHGKLLCLPTDISALSEYLEELNTNEELSLLWIDTLKGGIGFIRNPTPKQLRLNAMKWKI